MVNPQNVPIHKHFPFLAIKKKKLLRKSVKEITPASKSPCFLLLLTNIFQDKSDQYQSRKVIPSQERPTHVISNEYLPSNIRFGHSRYKKKFPAKNITNEKRIEI